MRLSQLRAVRSSFRSRYLVSAAAAMLLSACSSAMERFADNPSDADPVYTASVPKQVSQGTGDQAISSRPLGSPTKPPADSYASNSYNYQRQQDQTANRTPQGQLTANSGGQVQIQPGMTLYSVAQANGLTVAELAAANGIPAPYSVHSGQMISIPKPGQVNKVASAEPANIVPDTKVTAGDSHTVIAGETLYSLGRKYGVNPFAIADLNGLSHSVSLRAGQVVRIPASTDTGKTVAAAEPSTPVTPVAAPTPAPVASGPKDLARLDSPVQNSAEQIPAAQPSEQVAQSDDAQPVSSEPGLPGMRWPVRGKVISEFGAKPNGLRNEGINIAVPEGTSVRAADNGIVAYAGNELKGYGNLVLIRHEDGWVTAYAHNSELFVKRGDTVKRGDVIAKAGQTGSVSTPQLHFEVRKGATAMDPMRFLGPATAAN